ncbi:helix-turn-helix transcriptional regulator [Methylorubrum aminovorans]|uniref:helix-turn-helix transcriptional regulator n=1 Tax=Methylorubrum aminovorans TaxID=269069 RepID=UPI0024E107E1|nr:transcriptional regulator [Methylorubrum aminovorans]
MGNALRELRLERGWTHEEAATAMGVSRGQFIKLERGDRGLTERTIALAARAFEVSPSRVIGDEAAANGEQPAPSRRERNRTRVSPIRQQRWTRVSPGGRGTSRYTAPARVGTVATSASMAK